MCGSDFASWRPDYDSFIDFTWLASLCEGSQTLEFPPLGWRVGLGGVMAERSEAAGTRSICAVMCGCDPWRSCSSDE